jgi:hypothetical protein
VSRELGVWFHRDLRPIAKVRAGRFHSATGPFGRDKSPERGTLPPQS